VVPIQIGIPPRYLPGRPCSKCSSRNTCIGRSSYKEQIAQFKIFAEVEQALKDIILKAVDHDYLLEIEDEKLGFLNQMPR
jgi:hypothetical protein